MELSKVKDLKVWLEFSPMRQKEICPFYRRGPLRIKCQTCVEAFPKLPISTKSGLPKCPCHTYPLYYVKRKARRYIKEAGL